MCMRKERCQKNDERGGRNRSSFFNFSRAVWRGLQLIFPDRMQSSFPAAGNQSYQDEFRSRSRRKRVKPSEVVLWWKNGAAKGLSFSNFRHLENHTPTTWSS